LEKTIRRTSDGIRQRRQPDILVSVAGGPKAQGRHVKYDLNLRPTADKERKIIAIIIIIAR
jgi:hypothetical protein